MKLTALDVCWVLLAFSRLFWTKADSDGGNLPEYNGSGPCDVTLRPKEPCRQERDEITCPYLFSVPPMTVHLPKQLRQLEKLMKDLQMLKDSVDQLREMCADCTVRQNGRECERQREREHGVVNVGADGYEDGRNWFDERNHDFSQERVTNGGKSESRAEGDSDIDSGKRMLERINKWEAERQRDIGVIKDGKIVDVLDNNGKTQAERAKEKDKVKLTAVPTAYGNVKIIDMEVKIGVEENNRKGDETVGSDHHMGQDETKETGIKTQSEEERSSDGMTMSENYDEHTNKRQEQHGRERKKEMDRGMKVERNQDKPKQTESIEHKEKERVIKEGEMQDSETGNEIKTVGEKVVQGVQRDGDGELASSKAADFVSNKQPPHSTTTKWPRHEATDANKASLFASSHGSPPFSGNSSALFTVVTKVLTTTVGGLQTQNPGLGAGEQPSLDAEAVFRTTTATVSSLVVPSQRRATAATRLTSKTSGRPGPRFQLPASPTIATATTTSHQGLYAATFPGVLDHGLSTAKRNISSNTKTGAKPVPGKEIMSGEKNPKIKNTKSGLKPDQGPLPDRKIKHDQKQKPSFHKAITNPKSKPGKGHRQIPKRQRPQPDNSTTNQNLKNMQIHKQIHENTTDPNQTDIPSPKSHQKLILPVQRPISRQRPQTITDPDKHPLTEQKPKSDKTLIISQNLQPEKKPVHLPTTNKSGQQQKTAQKAKSKETSKLDLRSLLKHLISAQELEAENSEMTLTPQPVPKPETGLMDNSDDDPSAGPKPFQDSSPGPKVTPNQSTEPSQTLKVNPKPESHTTLNLSQNHPAQRPKPNLKTGLDRRPQTNQGLKTPLSNRTRTSTPLFFKIPESKSNKTLVPHPKHGSPTKPTAKPRVPTTQRTKPYLQLKPNSTRKTNLDPPQMTRTTSDTIQTSQTGTPPASGSLNLIVTNAPGHKEFSSSKLTTLDPRTFNSLDSGTISHRHTVPRDFTMSPNNRITSDQETQTTARPPVIQMNFSSVIHGKSPVPNTFYNKPKNDTKSEPVKDPKQVDISRPQPDELAFNLNLKNTQIHKHDSEYTSDQNGLVIQNPNSHQESVPLPVQRPPSYRTPQTVNATGRRSLSDLQPESVETPTTNQNMKPELTTHAKTHEEKPKPDQRFIESQYYTPVREPASENLKSFTTKSTQKSVMELMENSERPLAEREPLQDSLPGQTPAIDNVAINRPGLFDPSRKIQKINRKPEPGPSDEPNQSDSALTTDQKTQLNINPTLGPTPQTNQGLKTPLTTQMPNQTTKPEFDVIPEAESKKSSTSFPRHRSPPRPTVRVMSAPRSKPSLKRSRPKTGPPQITRTTKDTIQISGTNTPPAPGSVKPTSEATNSLGEPEVREMTTLDSKTFSSLESRPISHLHTLPGDFTASSNSRITSDQKPQTAAPPPSIQMTASPNRIMTGVLPDVSPSNSPGPTKPKQLSNIDPRLQVKKHHNVKETTTHRQIYDPHNVTTPVSTIGPDFMSTIPANSGPEARSPEVSTDSAHELRVKIKQVVAFFNNSLSPNGKHPDRHPTEHSEHKQRGSKPDGIETKLLITSKAVTVNRDCSDYALRGETQSGVYLVTPDLRSKSFSVFCDMEHHGGGWTLLQRRQDGSVSFNRTWAEYRAGFGELDGREFWLGNNIIHMLTRERDMVLRVELEDFDGEMGYAEYAQFRVSSERTRYTLSVGAYSGTAGDALRFSKSYDHNNRPFTTPDRDNDRYPSGNCGAYYSSGWWFDACMAANLNGRYYAGKYKGVRDGIFWGTWYKISTEYYPTNDRQSFKSVRMMIRPKGFAP